MLEQNLQKGRPLSASLLRKFWLKFAPELTAESKKPPVGWFGFYRYHVNEGSNGAKLGGTAKKLSSHKEGRKFFSLKDNNG